MSTIKLSRHECFVCKEKVKKTFSLPKKEERLKQWLELLGHPEFLGLDRSYLKNNGRVCGRHFGDWCFSSTFKERITRFALPETAECPYTSEIPPPILISPSRVSANNEQLLKIIIPSENNKQEPVKIVLSDANNNSGRRVKFVVPKSDLSLPEILSRVSSCQQRVPLTSSAGYFRTHPASNQREAEDSVGADYAPPPSYTPKSKLSKEEQIIRSQRATISRLKKKLEKAKASRYDFINQVRDRMAPEHYAFLMSQIKQASCRKGEKGRRWSEEDKAFALKVHSLSPPAYRLLKTKVLLPSRGTLERLPYEKRLEVHSSTALHFDIKEEIL